MAKTKTNAQPFQYRPFSRKQLKLLTWWMPQSPYSNCDAIVADGAVRSGKTIAMADSFTTWSLHNFKDRDFIIAGKSSGALERNVLRPMFQILAAKGIPYDHNRSENRVTIGTNLYHYFGANNEKSQDVVQGLTAAGYFLDEAALMPDSFREQCKARCSVDGAKGWMNCNPEGPLHPIKLNEIDKARENNICHLHFTMDDNLSLSAEVKARYERMFKGVFYLRYVKGLWVMAEGVIYRDAWSDATLFGDDEAPDWAGITGRWIGIDYGTNNPMVFLDCWYDGKTLWVMREYYWDSQAESRQKTDSQYADDLVEFVGNRGKVQVIIDPSAASFKAELKARGFWTVNAGNEVLDAKNDVLDGIRFVSSMLGLGRIRVHKRCTHTRAEHQIYAWDSKKAEKGIEMPLKVKDHTCDTLRYVAYTKMAGAVNWGGLI